jgi:hypothetical protein
MTNPGPLATASFSEWKTNRVVLERQAFFAAGLAGVTSLRLLPVEPLLMQRMSHGQTFRRKGLRVVSLEKRRIGGDFWDMALQPARARRSIFMVLPSSFGGHLLR